MRCRLAILHQNQDDGMETRKSKTSLSTSASNGIDGTFAVPWLIALVLCAMNKKVTGNETL